MSRFVAHNKWGHPHLQQLNVMGNKYKIKLVGKMDSCDGCSLVKAREKATTKTVKIRAHGKGERLFIDATGPYSKSRGGKKFWFAAVDDFSDKTWVYFAARKAEMIKFITDLVKELNGLGHMVKYIRCDNAGEHMSALQDFSKEKGIILEYTAPYTPKQNGRVEKCIHNIWQRALTMMVQANFNLQSQGKFWARRLAVQPTSKILLLLVEM